MNLTNMLARMRNKLDDPSNVRWSTALMTENLNESYKTVYLVMLQDTMGLNDYKVGTATISVLNGTQEYDLPSDFSVARKVYRLLPDYRELMPCEYTDHVYDDDNSDTDPGFYYLKDEYGVAGAGPTTTYPKVGIVKKPGEAFTLYVDYICIPAELSAGTDTPIITSFFHNLVVLDAILHCLEDKVEDARYAKYMGRWQRDMELFKSFCAERQRGHNRKFVDSAILYSGLVDQWP